ncbi:NACHT domain-containing protein [Roseofilum casamattae]|uniref:Pentapeptide repeat-containing protein n=1 Tax=Roseofilum casamattae BLCC-M143 TaxID=3022442 RepID=A0ABT7BV97_9CYAN|nr:pentapeptide repeat-containing protein [Roseofilum casamattae]MDJ1183020.1 pentapeptide repeat-containing protein [Roseofilum casamattae BLCC-M143]
MNFKIYDWLQASHIRLTASLPEDSRADPQAGRGLSQSLPELLYPAEFTGIAFQLVGRLRDRQLTSFEINILSELMERPVGIGRSHILPLMHLMGAIIRVESRYKPISRTHSSWFALQIAYLRGLDALFAREEQLRKPWLNRSSNARFLPSAASESSVSPELPWVAKLESVRVDGLSDLEIGRFLENLSQSAITQQIDETIQEWLVANGAEERESQLLVQRLGKGLFGYLLATIAEHHIALPQLQKFVRIGDSLHWFHGAGGQEYEILDSTPAGGRGAIDLQRELYRTHLNALLSFPCFEESFSWTEIYAIPKGFSGNSREQKQTVSAFSWANEQLTDSHSLALIEGASGLGKTRFCQLWAARVARERYPQWMPIIIDLKRVRLGSSLEETLDSVFPIARFTCSEGWLKLGLPPCLLILDGWESIPYSGISDNPQQKLLEQIAQFQQKHRDPRGWPRHKIVLTARSDIQSRLTLDRSIQWSAGGVFSGVLKTRNPLKISRFKLEPMDLTSVQVWFKNWSKVQMREIAKSYFDFLKQANLFSGKTVAKELSALVRKPLMLYLLAILHRDGFLEADLIEIPFPGIKLEIYDRIMTWLLGEITLGKASGWQTEKSIRSGFGHAGRSREDIWSFLRGRSPLSVRLMSEKAALILWQTGQNSLECDRLKRELNLAESESLALPPFLFVTIADAGTVPPRQLCQFSHRSLGEYLAAEAIACRLKSLMERSQESSLEEMARQLYPLLGFGLWPDKIEDLIVERLQREYQYYPQKFHWQKLTDALDRFYSSYCQGRWINDPIVTETHEYFSHLGNSLNPGHVDGAVAANLCVLLAAIARHIDLPFYPCGIPEVTDPLQEENSHRETAIGRSLPFNPDRLLALASRAGMFSPLAFWQRLRRELHQLHLPWVCLERIMLPEGNLQQTNLCGTNLRGAQLNGAELQGTQLSGADLSGADLSGADLSGANLSMADLTGAKLQGARLESTNFANACLDRTEISPEQKSLIAAQGVFWTWEQYCAYQEATWTDNKHGGDRNDANMSIDSQLFPPVEVAEDETIAADLEAYQNLDTTLAESSQDVQANLPTIGYTPDEVPKPYPSAPDASDLENEDDNGDTVIYTGSAPIETDDDAEIETVIHRE